MAMEILEHLQVLYESIEIVETSEYLEVVETTGIYDILKA